MKKGSGFLKKPQGMLILALALILVGSFIAGVIHTSHYQVDVSRIEFTTERGTLNGLLYMPKGAGAEDPRPVIVTTHGYLNSKEMQDAPAVEMSRRGYIVLALDMYDHGDSRWDADIPVGGQFGTFWVWAQFDAAAYMYAQPYTLKDENGNGYIAVSGHSMGGFSSFVAMYMDEMQSLVNGYRMICAGIPVGADLSYAAMVAPADQMRAAFGSRTVGVVAAHYDEFFFGKSEDEKTEAEKSIIGTVVYKDFANTANGKMFLGLDPAGSAGIAGLYYSAESGDLVADGAVLRESQIGERVIFTPSQTHPWNHISRVATSNLVSFYQYAFRGVEPNARFALLEPDNQLWQWKEIFSCIALIGFFLLMMPLIRLLLKLPFFKKSVTEQTEPVGEAKHAWGKILAWVAIVAGTLIPAVFFDVFMDKTATLQLFSYIACAFFIVGVAAAVMGFIGGKGTKDTQKQGLAFGGITIAVVSALLAAIFWFAKDIVPLSAFFIEPTVNQIAYWAMVSGLLAALITALYYSFVLRPQGVNVASYGISKCCLSICASLATALLAVGIGYTVLFITQSLFGVDYRFWTLAVRTVKIEHVLTALRYMPLFLVYYFFNAVAINANTRARKHGNLLAVLMNIGGLVLWVALQYGKLYITGSGMWPGQALNGILLFALIPCLGIAGVYARKLALKTNNIWLGSFVNTLLFTLIACANTAMFWNLV
ncbi:MAG: alpha/beta hydrolase [Clostridia bacterium]|nr:alpha/beta hydrolase [Clostridia bacterium]